MTIAHVHACLCGAATECEAERLRVGAVFRCPVCGTTWARVRSRRGSTPWIRVAEDDVRFHRLNDEPEPEAEPDGE